MTDISSNNNGLDSGLTTTNGFSPLTTSTLDQTVLPKRNVFGTVSGQVKPGQTTTITLNNLLLEGSFWCFGCFHQTTVF